MKSSAILAVLPTSNRKAQGNRKANKGCSDTMFLRFLRYCGFPYTSTLKNKNK